MTRTMYDGVNASRLPSNALMVAGYVDGLYAWSQADWDRFPGAVKVRIAVKATSIADVLDIETGNDMNPADWVSWAQLVRSHGKVPCAYMNTSTWPSVRKAFTSRGVVEPLYWVAQYDNVASIPAGAIGKQYYNSDQLGYDLSVVANSWPGVDSPTPSPAPTSTAKDDDDMHVDLKLNEPVCFTNPAAVKGGTAALCVSNDFDLATVRIALFDQKGNPVVTSHDVPVRADALRIDMPAAQVNKATVTLTAGSAAGLDVVMVS